MTSQCQRPWGKALILGSFETRFPSFLVEDVWLAAFTDVGAIARGWRDLGTQNVHASVGGGVRWLVSGQIPLDWIWPIIRLYPIQRTKYSDSLEHFLYPMSRVIGGHTCLLMRAI